VVGCGLRSAVGVQALRSRMARLMDGLRGLLL
jgi:hypothetical protein